jgi:hypothetical protein
MIISYAASGGESTRERLKAIGWKNGLKMILLIDLLLGQPKFKSYNFHLMPKYSIVI